MAKSPEAEERRADEDASKMRHGKRPSPGMDTELQAHIGRHLKASYEDVLNQPVPDRFHQLLEALDRSESKANTRNE